MSLFTAVIPMDASIDAITNNIQLALAPVFLLTAVATLINAISGRLARSVDRMRSIQNQLFTGAQAISSLVRDHMLIELKEAKTSYVIWTFVLGLISFMTSLSIVLAEVIYAYRSAGWNTPQD